MGRKYMGLITMLSVPVVDANHVPLMPTTPARARRWIECGKATGFWDHGVFCVRLNVEPSARVMQPVAVGVDPGSKREGITVKSQSRTFLNIQATAVDWVKDAVTTRRIMRRARRQRKTPCRKNRQNRARGGIPPSTRARWGWKLRLAKWLCRMFPVTGFMVEDIQAQTRGQRRWDVMFSPLECGKRWFYAELEKLSPVETRQGWETKELREAAGLKKSSSKLAERFDAHCVDSWVLANALVNGPLQPDNTTLLLITPLRFHRRQLHALQPAKGGIRREYGGTRSLGLKRGSLVKHKKYGICFVGGTSKGRISVHALDTGKRLSQRVKVDDCVFLAFNSWRATVLTP